MTVGLGISQGYYENNSVLFSVYDRDRIEAVRDAEWLALTADEGPKWSCCN